MRLKILLTILFAIGIVLTGCQQVAPVQLADPVTPSDPPVIKIGVPMLEERTK